jgi:hypothetical protein
MIYQIVARYQESHPDFLIVRHEDLSMDPQAGFRALYTGLGLEFTPQVAAAIQRSSSSKNPNELSQQAVHAVRLDSRANLENWKRRLGPGEIDRVRSLTQDLAEQFYPDFDWE